MANNTHGLAISVISNRGSRPFPMPSSTAKMINLLLLGLCCKEQYVEINWLGLEKVPENALTTKVNVAGNLKGWSAAIANKSSPGMRKRQLWVTCSIMNRWKHKHIKEKKIEAEKLRDKLFEPRRPNCWQSRHLTIAFMKIEVHKQKTSQPIWKDNLKT